MDVHSCSAGSDRAPQACGGHCGDYVPTVTAAGHASIYTGTTPAFHGIAGNDYMLHGRPTSSVRDTTVAGVGTDSSAGKRSPRNLLATTIGDQMKLATDFQARVVGVAIKDRAAVLPAGHAADGAYWLDGKAKRFVTSTYYRDALPRWVSRFNDEHQDLLAGDLWNSWRGAAATMQLAAAAIDGEQLGRDEVPDLLTISISSTDAAAHNYGLHVPRVDSIYYELDRQLALFFGRVAWRHTLGQKRGSIRGMISRAAMAFRKDQGIPATLNLPAETRSSCIAKGPGLSAQNHRRSTERLFLQ